ncbi:MAG: glycosyl hydrolase [Candidatus Zhuqueibacterota bacterium]
MTGIGIRAVAMLLIAIGFISCTGEKKVPVNPNDILSDAWPGYAISYSGYRAGQSPQQQIYPSQEQVKEDLKILEKNWRLIRLYGSDQHSADVLEVIRREKINLKVMLGMWLDGEPGFETNNQSQIQKGIELANAYKDVVIAVNVGNEIMVHWSNHKVPEEKVIQYIRQVKQAVSVPVTVADDFNFWREAGANVAREVDFVTMHTYPLWGKQDIDTGMPVTIEHYMSVKQAIPDKKIIIGEAGWATYTVGELHAPKAGDEQKQKVYFNQLMTWAKANNVIVFFFEAFDEPWKGEGTEGHWGLFSEGRKAKPAMQEWYPELMPDGPTSPSYTED